jgi:signal peptidase I
MHRFVVHENSMQPALLPGDRLLARQRHPRTGDVVVFREPAGERFYVKRVAAVGGARVDIDGASLAIEGVDGRFTLDLPHPERARSWTLLDDEVFVLSDDLRATRADSRVFGPIDTTDMFVVVLRYSPLHRVGLRL